ncbi:MAG: Asp23/Gls24 family envelope stress response protein [Clostridia bacterium]|nr:Asp23/Gls24 family envelope stress response protein [Clostridia bacterium]
MSEAETEFEEKSAEDEDLRITDESIAIVAGVAATEVKDVARMSSGFAGGIAEALGRRNLSKGVKVETVSGEIVIDLFVVVNYGKRLSDIAWEIQEHVKESVERLTGVVISAVNIHIQGIEFPDKKKTEAPRKENTPAREEHTQIVRTRDMSVFQYFDDGSDELSDDE